MNLNKNNAMAFVNKIKNNLFFFQIVVRSAMFLTLIGYVIFILLSFYFFSLCQFKERNKQKQNKSVQGRKIGKKTKYRGKNRKFQTKKKKSDKIQRTKIFVFFLYVF